MVGRPTTKSGLERAFALAGAAVYAGALGLCVYRFGVTWGVADASPTSWRPGAVAFDAWLFGLFAMHHSLLARASVQAQVARLVPERLLRSVYVWTASGLLMAVLLLWAPVGGDLYRVVGWRALVLGLVQGAGLWLLVRAAALIDLRQLAGLRPETRGALHTRGPYRLVRHPLYLGWVLLVFGPAHMTADRFAFAAISSLYLAVAIPWEERVLSRAYGDAYAGYRARVPWRLIPYLY